MDIILMPISTEEKDEHLKKLFGDEDLYVLYRLPESDDIQVGMMSESMRKYFPLSAHVWELDRATTKAFFYNGASELEAKAQEVTDRPVYRITPSEQRTVAGYKVLNGTPENGLRVWLEDVVDGKYTINPGATSIKHVK